MDLHENKSEHYILSLDIGTSNIRCFLYNKNAVIEGRSMEKMQLEYPEENAVEIDPEILWNSVKKVINDCIKECGIEPDKIEALGISLQRGTFIVWDKKTGKPIHNFIVWQDTRSHYISERWNSSYLFRLIQIASKGIHFVTRNNKFLASSVLRFHPQQVSMRLVWLFEKFPEFKKRAQKGELCFGTLDSWIIWKLTGGQTWASEFSNASSTGLYDPFTLNWSGFVCGLLGVPLQIFPKVLDTNGDFGCCDESLFGFSVPIRAAAGDQQAAMFGQGCFEVGDLKLTLGTGAFMNFNVGAKAHASVKGFYPVIGWKIKDEIVHLAEGCSNTCGGAIEWLKSLGFIEKASQVDQFAQQAPTSDNIFFIPAFNGLQAPTMDYSACGALLGLTLKSDPHKISRAVLESLAFRNYELYQSMISETNFPIGKFVCDGGVTASEFIMKLTSDMIGRPIEQRCDSEMSSLGVAFLAGLATGFWKSKKEILKLIKTDRIFQRDEENFKIYKPIFERWTKATSRAMNWYSKPLR